MVRVVQSRQWLVWLLAGCLVVLCLAHQKALASACLMSSCRSERPPGCGVPFSPLFAARLLLFIQSSRGGCSQTVVGLVAFDASLLAQSCHGTT